MRGPHKRSEKQPERARQTWIAWFRGSQKQATHQHDHQAHQKVGARRWRQRKRRNNNSRNASSSANTSSNTNDRSRNDSKRKRGGPAGRHHLSQTVAPNPPHDAVGPATDGFDQAVAAVDHEALPAHQVDLAGVAPAGRRHSFRGRNQGRLQLLLRLLGAT